MARIVIGICGAYFLVAGYYSFSTNGSHRNFLDFSYLRYYSAAYIPLLVGGVMGFCWNLIAKESSGSE